MTHPVLTNVQNVMPPNNPAHPQKKKKRSKKSKAARPEGTGYGNYRCSKCKAQWESPNSLAGVSQACKKCSTPALPTMCPPGKKLTPYQGSRRCFGAYKCTGCGKTWASGNSWADMGQECKECLVNVYPHMQRPLLHKKSNNNKRHLDEHCEKCKTIGSSCTVFGRTVRKGAGE